MIPPVRPACECGAALVKDGAWLVEWREADDCEVAQCPACGAEAVQSRLTATIPNAAWERLRRDRKLQALAVQVCRTNPWHWIANYVITEDSWWVSKGLASAYNRFPALEYLRSAAYWLWREPKTAWPKSRQMVLTWLVGTYILGEAMFLGGRLYMIQSKKEEDSVAVLHRISGVYDRLKGFAPWCGSSRIGPGAETALEFANGSRIVACAQGAHQVQSHTPAWLVLDEGQLQDEMEGAYHQALPCAERITAIGSAERGWFYGTMLADKIERKE